MMLWIPNRVISADSSKCRAFEKASKSTIVRDEGSSAAHQTSVGQGQGLSMVASDGIIYLMQMSTLNEYAEQNRDRVTVDFLGEKSHAQVKGDMVQDFRTHYQQHSCMRNKKLLNAIKIALEMEDEIVKVSNTLFFESQTVVDSKKEHEKALTEDTKPLDDYTHHNFEKGSPHKQEAHLNTPASVAEHVHLEQVSFEQPRKPSRKTRSLPYLKDITRIPFRKYEEVTLEGRIVQLLNNLKQKRDCKNELSRLFKRLKKIKNKQVMNRYIVSGLLILKKMIPLSGLDNKQDVLNELSSFTDTIISRAREIIMSTELIESEFLMQESGAEDSSGEKEAIQTKKREIILTIHRIIKARQPPISRECCKALSVAIYDDWEKIIEQSETTINQYASISKVLRDLRQIPPQVFKTQNCETAIRSLLFDTFVR